MPHGHDHSPTHLKAPISYRKAFAIGIALNVSYVAVEAVFGLLAHSLALVADAGA
jgi:cobalt-zinc-cadmium efflux system protein